MSQAMEHRVELRLAEAIEHASIEVPCPCQLSMLACGFHHLTLSEIAIRADGLKESGQHVGSLTPGLKTLPAHASRSTGGRPQRVEQLARHLPNVVARRASSGRLAHGVDERWRAEHCDQAVSQGRPLGHLEEESFNPVVHDALHIAN